MRFIILTSVLGGLGLSPLPAFGQESQSAVPAKALTEVMTARHLDAVAARDGETGRFVAALFFPGSQLLVISARCASPARLQDLLDRREYREVYMELGTASVADSKVFFQDGHADGLRPVMTDAVDIVYERDAVQTILDGDWKKHHLSEATYKEKFAAADTLYAQLLSTLVNALKQ
jgi:hypothetical protein